MAADPANEAIVTEEINYLKTEADAAVRDLKTAAQSYASFYAVQAGFDNNPSWEVGEGREVVLAGLGDLPGDRPELVIPPFVFNPEDYLNSDLLEKYSYISEFYDDIMEPKLVELIEAQSYFINESVQDALFALTHDRDIQILNDQIDAVDRKQASRGFPMPDSMLLAARNEVIVQHGDIRSGRNSEITALIAERAHTGMLAALGEGNKMEQVRSQFQLEFGKLYWNAAGYIINQWEAEVKAEIARFQGDLDLIKQNTGVDTTMAGFDLQYEQLENQKQLERLRVTVQELGMNLDSWKTSAGQRVAAARDAPAAGRHRTDPQPRPPARPGAAPRR